MVTGLLVVPDPLSLLCQYSELELAINTLVTEFHKAADDGPTMNTTQFQTMMSKQLPVVAKVPEAPPSDLFFHLLQLVWTF